MQTSAHSHLTLEQRYQIRDDLQAGRSVKEIADYLGSHRATIYREISRGKITLEADYDPDYARDTYQKNRQNSVKKTVLTSDIQEYIKKMLAETQSSPEQISGRIKRDFSYQISHETIYKFIWKNKKEGGLLYKYLRRKGRYYNKRDSLYNRRGSIIGRVDIDERPQIVDQKIRLGDLEGDLVIGKIGGSALITLVDRTSKYTRIVKTPCKKAYDVRCLIQDHLKEEKDKIHTITFDNGKEFSDHEAIASALNIKVYFAKPYHSWERGLNEHTNGLIRQYFPKKTDFDAISNEEIQKVENILNNRPRKVLNYKTPEEVFFSKTDQNSIPVAFQS